MAVKQGEKGVAGKGTGEIFRVAGPVVTATGLRPRMYDVQFVGEEQLLGEVIQIMGDKTVIQVYEDTSGVKPGEAVLDTGAPLVVELGPGLLGSIYDGVQRPLPVLQKVMGDFILRGVKSPGLTREKSSGPFRKRRTSSIGSWSRRTSAAGRSPSSRKGRSRSTRSSSSWTTESR